MPAAERFRTPVAVHLFLHRGDDLLLLRRFNTGYEDGNYSVIAGHLDGGETVMAVALREAWEEGGIDLDLSATEMVGVMHRLSDDSERIDFFVSCTRWTGDLRNMEPDKCDEFCWVAGDRLPVNTIPYVAAAIRSWRTGAWFSGHGLPDS